MLEFIKKYQKQIIIFTFISVLTYFIIYLCFYGNGIICTGKNLEKKDWLSFLGEYLTFIGTIAVSLIALSQSYEYNKEENRRRVKERFKNIQPIFAIEISRNVQIPGTVESVNFKKGERIKHSNMQVSIENVGQYPIMHVCIFEQYISSILKSGEKISEVCAFPESVDAKRWAEKVIVLEDNEERVDGNMPKAFYVSNFRK